MPGRISVFAAFCAAASLAVFISAEQADAQSLEPLAAVRHCSVIAASRHRGRSPRALSSAKLNRAQLYCAEARPHISGLRFWYSKEHRWTLYLNQKGKKCWAVRLEGPETLCLIARASVRQHKRQLARLDTKIEALLPRPRLAHDWLYRTFLCIHDVEGAWNDNTGNGYYGGLQMDWNFMHSYGSAFLSRWGTANNWPAWAQIEVAERAYRSGRGFAPWPNTARPCLASSAT